MSTNMPRHLIDRTLVVLLIGVLILSFSFFAFAEGPADIEDRPWEKSQPPKRLQFIGTAKPVGAIMMETSCVPHGATEALRKNDPGYEECATQRRRDFELKLIKQGNSYE